MKHYIDELVLTSDNISESDGKIYEDLGLDVIYDTHSIKILSSQISKITNVNDGINISTILPSSNTVFYDNQNNKIVVKYLNKKNNISTAIITSGGDAPGMNACIRSIVRSSIKNNGTVFGVYRGYDGLINDYICELGWDTETHSSAEGGTVLLSFRSKDFFSREGRKKAVFNLIKRNIKSLIILGGDGSLKGALILKNEFRELFKELIDEGAISNLYFNNTETEIGENSINDGENSINGGENSINGGTNSIQEREKSINDSCSSLFYEEFYGTPECLKTHPIKKDFRSTKKNLTDLIVYDLIIVGIPASIDNDISSCDYTLGCDTALNRIVESIDHLSSTMRSHQRVFVIEVMGRTCGWLALMSGYSCLADYIFIPEVPPLNWKEEVIFNIEYGRKHGKPGIFIIISEGAVDADGNKIESKEVLNHIKERDIDVRLLKLGHVQRGGPTSSFDRILGTLSGIKAYEEILKKFENYDKLNNDHKNDEKIANESKNDDTLENAYSNENKMINFHENDHKLGNDHKNDNKLITSQKLIRHQDNSSSIIIYDDGDIKSISLEEVIQMNDKIKEYENLKDYKSILSSRGNLFKISHSLFEAFINGKKNSLALCMEDINLRVLVNEKKELQNKYNIENHDLKKEEVKMRIGIMMYGTRSSGMNTSLNSIVQYCYMRQVEPYYILNGIEGLMNDQVIKAEMYEFGNDFNNGGCILGTAPFEDPNIDNLIKEKMKLFNLSSLIIIGDSSALELLSKINNNCVVLVPSASNNNMPSTDISIGTDTALNTILKVADCAKLTSLSLKKNVFVLEISGGYCGYLTLMASIASGAFDCFIPERKYLISHLSETAHRLRLRYKDNKRTGTVIFRNEKTFCNISTESFCKLLKTDNMNLFTTDYSVLGILQQGINPSPLDRIHASLMGFKSVDFCLENIGIGVVGIEGNEIKFSEINETLKLFDKNKKRVKNPKWIKYLKVCKSLE